MRGRLHNAVRYDRTNLIAARQANNASRYQVGPLSHCRAIQANNTNIFKYL
jgi:hypothetical protein